MKLTMKILILLFGALMLMNIANADSPREQFRQMVEQLQQSPTNDALREKITKLARTVKPAIPEELAFANSRCSGLIPDCLQY